MSEHAEAHTHPNYVKVWGWLVVLLMISVTGPFFGIKLVTLVTAFGIALVKAYLVAHNFMHVNLEPKFVVPLMVTALALMVLMFFLVAPDVMKHEGERWVNTAAAAPAIVPESEHGGGQEAAAGGAASKEPAFDAKAVFQTVCFSCHGLEGKGNGPAAAALNPKPANFTDPEFWKTRDKASIMKVITNGGAAMGKSPMMASYGGMYDQKQIGALAEYVMGFKP